MLTANEENTNHKSNGLVIKPVCCKNDKECIRFVKMIDLWAIIVLICCVLLPRVKALRLKRKKEKKNLDNM